MSCPTQCTPFMTNCDGVIQMFSPKEWFAYSDELYRVGIDKLFTYIFFSLGYHEPLTSTPRLFFPRFWFVDTNKTKENKEVCLSTATKKNTNG